jgi:hypothetical protein
MLCEAATQVDAGLDTVGLVTRGGHYMCKLGTTCVHRVFYGGLLSS